MKYLYVSTKKIEEYCTPESLAIHDFIFNKKRIFCTKLDLTHNNTLSFEFILMTYNIQSLLVHITDKEIETFLSWRKKYFPSGIRAIVNIYSTKDKTESLYKICADKDLTITPYFFKEFIPILTTITSRTH